MDSSVMDSPKGSVPGSTLSGMNGTQGNDTPASTGSEYSVEDKYKTLLTKFAKLRDVYKACKAELVKSREASESLDLQLKDKERALRQYVEEIDRLQFRDKENRKKIITLQRHLSELGGGQPSLADTSLDEGSGSKRSVAAADQPSSALGLSWIFGGSSTNSNARDVHVKSGDASSSELATLRRRLLELESELQMRAEENVELQKIVQKMRSESTKPMENMSLRGSSAGPETLLNTRDYNAYRISGADSNLDGNKAPRVEEQTALKSLPTSHPRELNMLRDENEKLADLVSQLRSALHVREDALKKCNSEIAIQQKKLRYLEDSFQAQALFLLEEDATKSADLVSEPKTPLRAVGKSDRQSSLARQELLERQREAILTLNAHYSTMTEGDGMSQVRGPEPLRPSLSRAYSLDTAVVADSVGDGSIGTADENNAGVVQALTEELVHLRRNLEEVNQALDLEKFRNQRQTRDATRAAAGGGMASLTTTPRADSTLPLGSSGDVRHNVGGAQQGSSGTAAVETNVIDIQTVLMGDIYDVTQIEALITQRMDQLSQTLTHILQDTVLDGGDNGNDAHIAQPTDQRILAHQLQTMLRELAWEAKTVLSREVCSSADLQTLYERIDELVETETKLRRSLRKSIEINKALREEAQNTTRLHTEQVAQMREQLAQLQEQVSKQQAEQQARQIAMNGEQSTDTENAGDLQNGDSENALYRSNWSSSEPTLSGGTSKMAADTMDAQMNDLNSTFGISVTGEPTSSGQRTTALAGATKGTPGLTDLPSKFFGRSVSKDNPEDPNASGASTAANASVGSGLNFTSFGTRLGLGRSTSNR
eukprot:Clim_evm11s235 gene=Clim_evmTU11s235